MKLHWRQTWPDRPNDGVGTHPDRPDLKARTYLEPDGRRWYWVVSEMRLIAQGFGETKEAAKSAAEEAASNKTARS
jgi:hypothetical protein